MRSKLKFIIALGLVGHSLAGQFYSEPDSTGTHKVQIKTGASASAKENLPFWILANNSQRFAKGNSYGAWLDLSFYKQAREERFLDYFYGAEGIGHVGNTSQVSFIQGFAGLKAGQLEVSAGWREEFFGINDSTLSIGNLVYTNNARPIPKITLSTFGWVPSPVFGKSLSFKAYLAHGWLEKNRYQSGAFLHQKLLYTRGQFFKQRLSLIVGLHHNAQWGGVNSQNETSQPTGLMNYAKIFLGSSGGRDASETDQGNALGNHLGSYDLSAEYKFKDFSIRNYWQFIWEDRSGLTPFNWKDGLIGISIKSNDREKLISGFNIELVRTSNQDAIKFNGDQRIVEPDNYFNNSVYRSGWTYQGRTIGNSLFFILNENGVSPNKIKNMLNGIHVGIEGLVEHFRYKLNYLSFKNHGNITERISPGLRINAISSTLEKDLGASKLSLQTVFEWGNYPGKNAGLILTYSRCLSL